MKAKTLFTLVGVSYITLALCTPDTNESEAGVLETEQTGLVNVDVEKRQLETPEVVLQLKYDRGELNRIYLAQFRKGVNNWAPSVPARIHLCADLCHAGLGGSVCGPACKNMIPIGLQTALTNVNESDAVYGVPRTYVCPTLCGNRLGEPLCSCNAKKEETEAIMPVDWSAICETFCITDRFTLSGCPTCQEDVSHTVSPQYAGSRVLNTADGWVTWCNAQCRQGQGGAACNCDRSPFQ